MSTDTRNEFDGADHRHVLGALLSITADAGTTNGEYTVLDMLVPPGFENGLHTHEPSEVFHVIDGEIRLHVEGEDRILGPGASGYVPKRARHGFENLSDDVCRVVAVMSPAGSEGFFREGGAVASERVVPPAHEVSESELHEWFALGERYGIEFIGPLPPA